MTTLTTALAPGSGLTRAEASYAARRRRKLVVAALVFAGLAALPYGIRDVYLQNVLILTLMYAALSQSWNILGGYCGQVSLGHALYFGFGAYATTVLFVNYGMLPWFGMLAGGMLSAVVALALGYPCFRLAGHYFSIATIVIAEIGLLLVHNWDFVGGAMGIQWPFNPDSWWTLQFARDKIPYVHFAIGFLAVVWFVTWVIEGSRWGYWWRAVKDDAQAAESLGVEVFRSKMAAAAVSAFFTAIGGGFYAAYVSYIDPESVMSFRFSLLFALPAVLGGIGTLWGPLVGAAILIPLTEISRSYLGGSGNGLDLMLYGVLVMVVALARPEGVLSLFRRTRTARNQEATP
ncbi:branched-chain amino acid ABC transporter permease [Methylobacterium nonmethylotrophicum]|uniref:Branched-chain amino acid ABC transporter permease n=1 Tax=Methylobacterium nonmethylotrophicum TaxID=1141884 RepID=A0A4Z0NSH6_9HYPH|nr:branched-chain amino acid ABC transporter permease [Methylobacterium nonmethylotrophicum]TGE00231.1 branched-chain amino acid ABC transporter permease [Methylobacterium nonmethylotrophicum]